MLSLPLHRWLTNIYILHTVQSRIGEAIIMNFLSRLLDQLGRTTRRTGRKRTWWLRWLWTQRREQPLVNWTIAAAATSAQTRSASEVACQASSLVARTALPSACRWRPHCRRLCFYAHLHADVPWFRLYKRQRSHFHHPRQVLWLTYVIHSVLW
jgi:hypothetical protein